MADLPNGTASGLAAKTVGEHSAPSDFKLFSMWFCPFAQRTWIALELKKLPYQYIEINAYAKPKELLEVNPKGLVPSIRAGDWAIYESLVTLDYIEDLAPETNPLLPKDPQKRAEARLWADYASNTLNPTFHRLLSAHDVAAVADESAKLAAVLRTLTEKADAEGPFFQGAALGWVDVVVAPWLVRLSRVLAHYRGWPAADKVDFGDAALTARFARWVAAVEGHDAVRRTVSDADRYAKSYAKYAK
ncbi:hypothetical protein KEM52_006347 [Ascosphaera acerosa]|nr:hypothetical protein KEM52_006347 [Ascosphaera acerosa]